MPKGPKNKAYLKPSSTSIALLLVKITLTIIGQLPLAPLRFLLFLTYQLLKFAKHFSNISLTIPKFSLKLHFPNFPTYHLLKQNRKRGRPKKMRLSRKTKIIIAASAFLIFISSYTAFLLAAAYELPTPTRLISFEEPLTTEFYDRNGTLLYRLYEGKNRTLVNLSQIPKHLIEATIAIEDQNFYQHIGVDPKAIVRALYHNLQTGNQEGGSTLTQQLIKNSLLTPKKSYVRKIKEAILAVWTETIYSKEQILQMYYNEAPYGGAIVGIAAAAQTYFDKQPSELNLAESAFLAGLPASPTQFSPYGPNPQLAKLRQKNILEKMVKYKYITQNEADEAYAQDLRIKPLVNNIYAPHFVFYIRDLLVEKFGPRTVSQGGLKVYTTLDLNLQQKVEKIVKDEVDGLLALNVQNAAAMVSDSKTGQILAMVGSRDYHYPNFGNFNAALALRQPGSSIKPVTYAAAFKNGFSPSNIILDTPVSFGDEWGNSYSPVNYDGKFRGPVTLRQALGNSLNIPAVKLLASIGITPMVQTARDLGITTFDNPQRFGLSLTLGSAEVRMIEMMGAYGTFSQMGKLNTPTGILKITSSKGDTIEEYKDSSKEVLSPAIAFLIANILSDDNARSLAFGVNSLLNIPGYEVAVKTGTSDNKRDNWTFGFTPNYVTGVWVGNPDNSPMNPRLASGITGAAPIWNKIMHTLLDGSTPLSFEKPAGIAEITIEGRKDFALSGIIPKTMVRTQKKDNKLILSDPFSSDATPSAQAILKEGVAQNGSGFAN